MSHNSRYPPRSSGGGGGGGHRQGSSRDYRDRDYRDNRDNRDNRDRRDRDRYAPRREFGTNTRQPEENFPRSDSSYSDRNRYDSRNSVFSPRPPPPPAYDAPPPPPPPSSDRFQMPQGEFTFRVDKPSGVQDADSYRPDHGGRRHRNDRSNRGPHSSRNNNTGRPSRGGGRFEGRKPWRPFVAAERELLRTDHNTGEAEAFYDADAGATFRNLDELSDSEEAEMEISGDEPDDDAEPSHKRARTSAVKSTVEDSTPKWSNPDPYTALPPETATVGRKKDVVQMIRKARVQSKEIRESLPSTAADFISLDFDESGSEDNDIVVIQESSAPGASGPVVSVPTDTELGSNRVKVPSLVPDSALGSRKRTHDDHIKPPHTALKKPAPAPSGNTIVDEWRRVPHLSSSPWMRGDHSQAKGPLVWLHKEVVDFYDYIKPRDFEQRLRAELVQDMKKFCKDVYKDADIYAFGSFPSGLYLPTGDMDLVLLSDKFMKRGVPAYHTVNALQRFRERLKAYQIPWRGDVELITKARVPLAKYIDRKTGLKVDVSFENSSGLDAINTFLGWKEQYPGMPALVTLIKHFLMMRGLNEPVNGGIGGFSVICLVVSMLQLSPEVQSGALNTTHHLGDLLMRFFDLYGNKFDYNNIAIRLFPPGYIQKDSVRQFTYRQYNRLSIIDPNNPANDIAGGSSNTRTIVDAFAKAHRELLRRMKHIAEDPQRKNESILDVIIGGNYSSFEQQRAYLESLAEGTDIVPEYEAQDFGSRFGHRNRGGRRGRR